MIVGTVSVAVFAGSITFIVVTAKAEKTLRRKKKEPETQKAFYENPVLVVALTIVAFSIFEFLTYKRVWIVLLAGVFSWAFSKRLIKHSAEKRKRKILKELPQVVETMALLIDAGLNIPEAIKHVVKDEKGIVGDMLSQANLEMDAGTPRQTALKRMASQSGIDEMRFFVKALVQAEEFGKPVRHVLLDMARSLRIRRRYDIAARANRLPTVMLVPVFVFILPPVLLLYTLPALINMRQMY